MKYAEQLWQQLSSNDVFIKDDWQAWLVIGANGQIIEDENDSVLFRHDVLKKAIRITFEQDGYFEFGYFFDDFGDNEIKILNVFSNDFNMAQSRLESLIKNWLKGLLADDE